VQVYGVLTIEHTKVRFEEHKKQQHVEEIAYLKFSVCEYHSNRHTCNL